MSREVNDSAFVYEAPYSLSKSSNRMDQKIQRRRSDCNETEYFGLTCSTLSSSICYSRVVLNLSSLPIESEPPVSILTPAATHKSKKMLSLVRVLNHARPYSTLERKSSPFHDLAPLLFMFFRSRIDATHTRIIGHSVYGQHVGRGPGVHRMSVCVTTQIIETGHHFVL